MHDHRSSAFYFSRFFFLLAIYFFKWPMQNYTNLLNVLYEELKSIGLLLSAPNSLIVG